MDKKSLTANDLAIHFEVSKRTILRDIEALTMAGIPVYTMQGRGGGISILDKFVLNKTVISEDEQQQILFALRAMSATQHIDTDSILNKLQGFFEKADRDWIEVNFSRWGYSEADNEKFDSLKNAVINGRAIRFNYSSSYGETSIRKVYPLKLVFRSSSWHLQAFCLTRNDYRIFKVNRMLNVNMLADSFDYWQFQTPEVEQSEYQSPTLLEVKLYFEPYVAYRVYDEFNEQQIIKNADGSLIVSLCLPNDYWLYDYILSFGDAVEVIEPQEVRDEVTRQAGRIITKYSSKT
jgi:predicted DNA-binding transcriptional regulator YafY